MLCFYFHEDQTRAKINYLRRQGFKNFMALLTQTLVLTRPCHGLLKTLFQLLHVGGLKINEFLKISLSYLILENYSKIQNYDFHFAIPLLSDHIFVEFRKVWLKLNQIKTLN